MEGLNRMVDGAKSHPLRTAIIIGAIVVVLAIAIGLALGYGKEELANISPLKLAVTNVPRDQAMRPLESRVSADGGRYERLVNSRGKGVDHINAVERNTNQVVNAMARSYLQRENMSDLDAPNAVYKQMFTEGFGEVRASSDIKFATATGNIRPLIQGPGRAMKMIESLAKKKKALECETQCYEPLFKPGLTKGGAFLTSPSEKKAIIDKRNKCEKECAK